MSEHDTYQSLKITSLERDVSELKSTVKTLKNWFILFALIVAASQTMIVYFGKSLIEAIYSLESNTAMIKK